MTLTIDVTAWLKGQVPEEEIKAVATAAVEIWLAQEDSTDGVRFSKSAVPFVRRLIAENHEPFGALSQP